MPWTSCKSFSSTQYFYHPEKETDEALVMLTVTPANKKNHRKRRAYLHSYGRCSIESCELDPKFNINQLKEFVEVMIWEALCKDEERIGTWLRDLEALPNKKLDELRRSLGYL